MADTNGQGVEKPLLVKVNVPESSIVDEVVETFQPARSLLILEDDPFRTYKGKGLGEKLRLTIFSIFPILDWGLNYKAEYFFGDVIAGLTIASLAVPQDLAYAKLANMPPVNGLYSSFVPPLIYAVLGTSKHIAIGPVAVVSLLLGDLLTDYYDPKKQKNEYYNLAITATFFAGILQFGMGLFRLGFVIDFLSHAAVVGFMAGAAVTIALQQLKGILGYKDFTQKTDIVRVLQSVDEFSDQFVWRSFLIGVSFLVFLVALKVASWFFKKTPGVGKTLFYLNAVGPLLSVVIATASVYGTRADKHGVRTVGNIKKGVNPISLKHFSLKGDDLGNAIAVALVSGLIALTEAVAIARTFAAIKGYHINGNQEMIALGTMNICGSFTSCYVTTGSFSRSAVNFAAGGETMLTNIVMALVVLVTLVAITPLFKYLPNAVLSAIIVNAVVSLIDLPASYQIWKTDKLDFLVLLGAFFGVLFISIEIGLLIAVSISMLKIIVQVTRPRLAALGLVPGSNVYRNVKQYPQAEVHDGILVLRIDAPIYFPNANFVREKVLDLATIYAEDHVFPLTHVILDLTPVSDVDTTGIHSVEELYRILHKQNIQLGLSNPSNFVLRKLKASGFLEELGEEWLFLSSNEAVKTCSLVQNKEV